MDSSDPKGAPAAAVPVERPRARPTDSVALFVAVIVTAEVLIAMGAVSVGVATEMLVVLALAQLSMFGGPDARSPVGRRLIAALLLVPLLRMTTVVIIPVALTYQLRVLLASLAVPLLIAILSFGMRLPDSGLASAWGRHRVRRLEHLAFVSSAVPISFGLHLATVHLGSGVIYPDPAAWLIPVLMVGAAAEEFAFRGFVQGQLQAAGVSRAVVLTGVLFVATYLWWGSPVMIAWAAFASVLFGWYRRTTGSVWAVAANHAVTLLFVAAVWPNLV